MRFVLCGQGRTFEIEIDYFLSPRRLSEGQGFYQDQAPSFFRSWPLSFIVVVAFYDQSKIFDLGYLFFKPRDFFFLIMATFQRSRISSFRGQPRGKTFYSINLTTTKEKSILNLTQPQPLTLYKKSTPYFQKK